VLILPSTTTFQAKIFGFTNPNSDRPATSSRVPCTYVTRNTEDITGPSDEPSLKPLIDSRPCLHRIFLSRVESTDNSDEDEESKEKLPLQPAAAITCADVKRLLTSSDKKMGRRVSRTSEQMILSLDLRVWGFQHEGRAFEMIYERYTHAFWRPSRVVTTYTPGFGLYVPPVKYKYPAVDCIPVRVDVDPRSCRRHSLCWREKERQHMSTSLGETDGS
jgi:hypothetical protein